MFQHQGIWLPDGSEAFAPELGQEYEGKPTYQLSKFLACLPYIKDFSHAIDIGAHVGLWSRVLATKFAKVTAFEPVKDNADCWRRNLAEHANADLVQAALADRRGELRMMVPDNSPANAHISEQGEWHSALKLDDWFLYTEPTFIKLDAEGYELPIIKGAEQLIRRARPTMIIEQKGHPRRYGFCERAAVKLVQKWGAKVVKEITGDFICQFP
jgi:FkbM family methyltransferase